MNWDLARLIWEIFVSLVAAGSCFVAWQASRSRVTQDQIEALDSRQDHASQTHVQVRHSRRRRARRRFL
jgi:hypothetical protein